LTILIDNQTVVLCTDVHLSGNVTQT